MDVADKMSENPDQQIFNLGVIEEPQKNVKAAKKAKHGVQQSLSNYIPAQPKTRKHAFNWPPKGRACPILNLPVEVFDEIVSYFPCPYPWSPQRDCPLSLKDEQFPHNRQIANGAESVLRLQQKAYIRYLEWRQDFAAISHTCQMFRARTMERLWEYFATGYTAIGQYWRQLHKWTSGDIYVALPHLQPLVKSVILHILVSQSRELMPRLSLALATLPNLKTITITNLPYTARGCFTRAFESVQLPSVEVVSVTPAARQIISSCPNAREVWCFSSSEDPPEGTGIVPNLHKNVEILGGEDLVWDAENNEKTLKQLVKSAPNLREFDYHGLTITQSNAAVLAQLGELRRIRIWNTYKPRPYHRYGPLPEWRTTLDVRQSVDALISSAFANLEEIVVMGAGGVVERIAFV